MECVDFGEAGPPRCKSCRAYICAFNNWKDQGRKWDCVMCEAENDTPVDYVGPIDHTGQRLDRRDRAELYRGSIDYIAPKSYWQRTPMGNLQQPHTPSYVFLVDCSAAAVATGATALAIRSVRDCLDALPAGTATRAGVVAYGRTPFFFKCANTRVSKVAKEAHAMAA